MIAIVLGLAVTRVAGRAQGVHLHRTVATAQMISHTMCHVSEAGRQLPVDLKQPSSLLEQCATACFTLRMRGCCEFTSNSNSCVFHKGAAEQRHVSGEHASGHFAGLFTGASPCTDGTHQCDPENSHCLPVFGGAGYECGCLRGFREASPNSVPHTCERGDRCGFGQHINGTKCAACAPGRYANQRLSRQCAPCAAGTFAAGSGHSSCDACPRGEHTAGAVGQTQCVQRLSPEPTRDCKLSSWSAWTPCTASCGGGARFRRKTVLEEPRGGGTPCPGKAELYEPGRCHTAPCGIAIATATAGTTGANTKRSQCGAPPVVRGGRVLKSTAGVDGKANAHGARATWGCDDGFELHGFRSADCWCDWAQDRCEWTAPPVCRPKVPTHPAQHLLGGTCDCDPRKGGATDVMCKLEEHTCRYKLPAHREHECDGTRVHKSIRVRHIRSAMFVKQHRCRVIDGRHCRCCDCDKRFLTPEGCPCGIKHHLFSKRWQFDTSQYWWTFRPKPGTTSCEVRGEMARRWNPQRNSSEGDMFMAGRVRVERGLLHVDGLWTEPADSRCPAVVGGSSGATGAVGAAEIFDQLEALSPASSSLRPGKTAQSRLDNWAARTPWRGLAPGHASCGGISFSLHPELSGAMAGKWFYHQDSQNGTAAWNITWQHCSTHAGHNRSGDGITTCAPVDSVAQTDFARSSQGGICATNCTAAGCPIHGGWSAGPNGWTACSKPCGGGIRARTCTNPAPLHGGNDCVGTAATQRCNTHVCGRGGWSSGESLGAWSSCSQSCGGGTQHRVCTDGSTLVPASRCDGVAHTRACNVHPCGGPDADSRARAIPAAPISNGSCALATIAAAVPGAHGASRARQIRLCLGANVIMPFVPSPEVPADPYANHTILCSGYATQAESMNVDGATRDCRAEDPFVATATHMYSPNGLSVHSAGSELPLRPNMGQCYFGCSVAARQCRVTAFTPWTGCSVSCVPAGRAYADGEMRRSRSVVLESGATVGSSRSACPPLIEKRECRIHRPACPVT